MCRYVQHTQQVVEVIWHKVASLLHTDGSVVFARWCQCDPHPVHPISICTVLVLAHADLLWVYQPLVCAVMSWAGHFSPSKLPLHKSESRPPSNTWSSGPPESKPNQHLDWFSHFCTAYSKECPYFTMGCHFSPSKLPLHDRFSRFCRADGHDHATSSVAIGCLYLVLQYGLRNAKKNWATDKITQTHQPVITSA